MSRHHWIRASVALTIVLGSAFVAGAGTFTWDGGDGSTTDMTAGINWVDDIAPSITTNPATDELHFGSAAFTTVQAPGQMFIDQIIFDVGAPTYTFPITTAGGGNDIAFVGGTNRLLVNNSSNMQLLVAQLNLSGVKVKTPGGPMTIGGDPASYLYAGGSSTPVSFWLTNDVTVNAQQFQNAPRNVYGANGPTTTTSDPSGALVLNVASGTANTSNTNFTGVVNIWSGAVRIGDSNALGRAANNTFIHGTFVNAGFSNAAAQIDANGFEHGFGRLELNNNITSGEAIRIDSRIGDVADYDHIVNISGDNSLTNLNALGGGGHINFRSDSGTMTISTAAETTLHISDPGQQGGSAVNSVFTFRGAGNIVLAKSIGASDAGFGTAVLRKQGSGTLTMNGIANAWDGGTLVEGGMLIATATFSTVGSRVHVASSATLDLSPVGGLSLAAGKTLSGGGTVKGNITTSDATAVISPGGTGSFDANDLLTVADNSGTLTLQNDLNMSAGGSLQWSLGALSTSGPGANFDQLVVGGNLTLGGTSNLTLDFSQLAGTGPGSGNAFWNSPHSWTIVDTAGNNATTNFASLTNALFAGGQFTTAIVGGDIILNYSIGGLTPGDFNSDGQVNGVDFGIWQNSFPTTAGGTQATGDADGDGDIDGADFIIWQTHYPTPANPTTAVPEPSSLMLALASVASVILVRRRANQ